MCGYLDRRKETQIFKNLLQFKLSMLVHNPFYDSATSNLYMARNWRHALDHNNMGEIITACARL